MQTIASYLFRTGDIPVEDGGPNPLDFAFVQSVAPDLFVVERNYIDTARIQALQSEGTSVAGYMNLGTVDANRQYHAVDPGLGSDGDLAPLGDPRWRAAMTAEVDALLALGFDTLYLDDLVSYLQQGSSEAERSAAARQMVDLVNAVVVHARSVNPQVDVIFNGAPNIRSDAGLGVTDPARIAYREAADVFLAESYMTGFQNGTDDYGSALTEFPGSQFLAIEEATALSTRDSSFMDLAIQRGFVPLVAETGYTSERPANATTNGNPFSDYVLGTGGNDRLRGDGGNDVVIGGAGDDHLSNGGIPDRDLGSGVMSGGSGNDTIVGWASTDLITGGTGDDSIHASGGRDIVSGGVGRDTIEGGFGQDLLQGDADNDSILGEGGNDTAYGGTGLDWIDGGAGNDWLYGQASDDTLMGEAGSDRLFGGRGNDSLCGGAANDTLWGAGNDDRLFGDDGDDVMHGEGGRDTMQGGAGNDSMTGGWFSDWMYGGADDDTIEGDGGYDHLFGGRGNDLMSGGILDDTLYGAAGSDSLIGDSGNDMLHGEGDSDVFVFADGFGNDTINDFDALDDNETIDLSAVTAITDFNDLITGGHVTQVGSDLVISDLNGNSILLVGTQLADILDGGDVIF